MGSQVRLPAPSHEVTNQGALGGDGTASEWDQWDIWALSYQRGVGGGEGKAKTSV